MAQIVSELGDWFYSVAIFSFLLELTGSAQMVAFAFMTQVLPQCFMAPTAGVINDRIRRQQVMIFADWSRAAIVLAMTLVRSRGTLWLLYMLLFLETVCWALFEPGQRAVIPNIVKGDEIPVANALCAATWSVNFAIGAALGGFVAVCLRPQHRVRAQLDCLSSRPRLLIPPNALHRTARRKSASARRARSGRLFADPRRRALHPAPIRSCSTTIFVKGGAAVMGTNWVILPVLGERVFPIRLHG